MFCAALAFAQPPSAHHLEIVALETPVFSAIASMDMPDIYSVLATDRFCSDSFFVIRGLFSQKWNRTSTLAKKYATIAHLYATIAHFFGNDGAPF
jgi:hypothetical protein